jgi:cation transport regulator ChaC
VVKRNGLVSDGYGHAVYVDNTKRRETTAGPGVNLDSNTDGTAGGWEK